MKLKIVSDGTSPGTRVEDENGNHVENVTQIEWRLDSNGMSRCELCLTMVSIQYEGLVERYEAYHFVDGRSNTGTLEADAK